jgi:hypothetical protein
LLPRKFPEDLQQEKAEGRILFTQQQGELLIPETQGIDLVPGEWALGDESANLSG